MRDIAFSGFVLTADEWETMDVMARWQLLAVVMRRDEPWVAAAPVMEATVQPNEAYESYQLLYA